MHSDVPVEDVIIESVTLADAPAAE